MLVVIRWEGMTEDDAPKIKEFLDSFSTFLVDKIDTVIRARELILKMPEEIRRGTNVFFLVDSLGYGDDVLLLVTQVGFFLVIRQIREYEEGEEEVFWDLGRVYIRV